MNKLLNKKNLKIGILGGTFDPPHFGHVEICKIALKKLKLNNIFWVITNQNPLKVKPDLKLEKRKILCKKILQKQKKIQIKKLNKKQSYLNTYNLVKTIKNKNMNSNFYFLMGADNLINLHKWKKWKKIPEIAKIVVFARPGFSLKALNSIAAKKLNKRDWIYINSSKFDISSTKLKKI